MADARTIPSPCIRQCTLDPATEQCLGCLRTLEEICAWSSYTDEQRAAVMEAISRRRRESRRATRYRGGGY